MLKVRSTVSTHAPMRHLHLFFRKVEVEDLLLDRRIVAVFVLF